MKWYTEARAKIQTDKSSYSRRKNGLHVDGESNDTIKFEYLKKI